MFHPMTMETEWLYAPDQLYAEHGGVRLHLQILFPYRRDMPETERYPLVLFVPGAAWYRQEMYNSVPQWAKLAEQGMIVAAVQVRSSKEAVFPAQTEDLMAALRHMVQQAARWHADPQRVFLAGQSSGGHIALLTLLRHGQEIAAAPDYTLRGVIALSAPTDMRLCGGQPSLDLLGLTSLADDPAKVDAASAGTYVISGAALPRLLLIHGMADDVVPIVHSETLCRRWQAAHGRATFLQVSGAGHGGPWPWRDAALERMARFVREG